MKHLFVTLFCGVFITNCTSTTSTSSSVNDLLKDIDSETQQIITKGWNSVGSWDTYSSLKSIKYKKRSILYLEDGTIESKSDETHEMTLLPDLSGVLSKTDSSGTITQTIFDSGKAYKVINGDRVEGSANKALSSFLSSHYVLFAPFKLADEGSKVTLDGTKQLPNGKEVYSIKSVSTSDNQHPDGEDDTWFMFFDTKTYNFEGYLIHHPPTYALIENDKTINIDGMTFSTYRKSWRVDGSMNKQFLRGEFWYSDYELTFQ